MINFEARLNEVTYQYEQRNQELYKEFYEALKRLQKNASSDVSEEAYIIEEIFLRRTSLVEFAYKSGVRDACKFLYEINRKLSQELGEKIDSVTG